METIDIISIITIAFLGSFGHCIGMCGGIVIAYSSTKIEARWTKIRQSTAHILYSIGRVFTYTILGGIFGYLGGVATFSHMANGILWLVVGSVMLLIGLSLLGYIKFVPAVEHSLSSSNWYKKNFTKLLQSQTFFSFFILGMLNGLLPCGLVYFFAIVAVGTGSWFFGAIVMLIFGLSTVPALFSLGFFVALFKQTKLRDIFIKLSAVLVILYGFYTIYNGYNYIITPDRTLLNCHI
ncbi:MAG: beta-carotene 15,15'-monooxygenase [Campylobacteraceae bacterium 4484_166]|nr:MAG: beta-carotene 15,15'-monooxygenase [Campylobacteraceae bacterium 4484_166]